MTAVNLRFDMRSLPGGPSHGDLYAAALDMVEWAESLELGPVSVSISEHHGSEDGYVSSPFVLAAAIAGRTKRTQIAIAAALMPLQHPLRLAEDIATIDLVSQGRVTVVLGAGYRPEEFAMFGVDITARGALMERGVETLQLAWTGEPFDFDGETVRITPRPFQRPRPPILLGGSSSAAAKRAARLADGFIPSVPEYVQPYLDECARLGKPPGPCPSVSDPSPIVLVHSDPDVGWRLVGDACLHDVTIYADWIANGRGGAGPYFHVADVDALRVSGRYSVLTPAECVQLALSGGALMLHPLVGGIEPEVAWSSLRLVESNVVPHLRGAST